MKPIVNTYRAGVAVISLAFVSAALLLAEDKTSSPANKSADVKAPPPAEIQQNLRKYLYQKSGRLTSGTALPTKSPWVWCWEQYEAAAKQDPKVLYALIAEHLAIADKRYFTNKVIEERRKGLGMTVEASRCALYRLKDTALAVQICEGYLKPHLDDADTAQWKHLGRQNVIEAITDVYAEAKDAPKLIEAFKMLITDAPNRNTADAGRLRLAQVLDRQGEYEEAIRVLKEIDDKEGVGGAKRLIPELEKKLKAKQAKEKRP
jgi:tetratricopeptide (TPR) repeat protein